MAMIFLIVYFVLVVKEIAKIDTFPETTKQY